MCRVVLGTIALFYAAGLPKTALAQGLDLKAEEENIKIGRREYSPYLHRGCLQQVFWGDTHLQTSYSTDAGMIGNRLGPEEAYRFARRDRCLQQRRTCAVVAPAGFPGGGGSRGELRTGVDDCRIEDGKPGEAYSLWGEGNVAGTDPLKGQDTLTRTMCERISEAAEEYNNPGKFTALIGYESTSIPGGNNLHRNIVYRDGKDEERALYYVRVLEILTPRWTTYDAAFFGVDLPVGVPATHQERAYTSPIWYMPGDLQ